MNVTLKEVLDAMGITGSYQNDQIQPFYDDVVDFIIGAGVKSSNITAALVARGVLDTWNYGAGDGKLSEYFIQRVTQLAYKN